MLVALLDVLARLARVGRNLAVWLAAGRNA
jgi:hypothetical protein